MIADSPRNRLITRGCIFFVASVAPLSLTFVIYVLVLNRDLLRTSPWQVIFVWSVAEIVFWVWSSYKYKSRPLQFARVVPSYEERVKLKADCRRIIEASPNGPKEFIDGWFKIGKQKAQIADLQRENIKDWLCWAYFASPSDEVEQDPELRDEMEETLRELYGHLEGSFPDKVIPPGRNPAVDCIRLTLDPINSEHRPLAFYLVVYLLQAAASTLFRIRGYTYYPNASDVQGAPVGYWYRAPTTLNHDLQPIMLIHGVGSVLSLIWFVTTLAARVQDRPIFILELKNVSMRLPRPTSFPSPLETTSQINQILNRHLSPSSKVIFFGHSLGSALTVWILKYTPDRIAGLVLVDPISLLLQHSDVAYNFIYRTSQAAAETFFEWIAREQGVALSLARNFHWFDNVFPMICSEEDDGGTVGFFPGKWPVAIFLSEGDCIVPTARIQRFLSGTGKGGVELHVMPGLDHGGFLFNKYWLDTVLKTLIGLDSKEKSYIE